MTTLLPPKDLQDKKLIDNFHQVVSPQSLDQTKVEILVNGQSFPIPEPIQELFVQIIENIAEGKAVSLTPVNSEFTTQQAADYLNVSRPFLIQLLNENKIKYRKVGSHRRVLFEDLVKYKEASYKQSIQILDELTSEGQKLNLY
jgi:excisionase family DNA binding protein